MDKRGLLLAEETLKTVIAVIAIGVLVFFLASLYFSNSDKQEKEQAEASLQYLIDQINLESEEVQIYNPEGWGVLSWPLKEEAELPDVCLDKKWESCICISEMPLLPVADNFLEKSNENGICLENPKKLVVKNDGISQALIVIESPYSELNINYESKVISKK